jgi:hypothetical protein
MRFTPATTAFVLKEDAMRVGAVVLVLWLIIGAIAAGQRGYYGGSTTCAKTSDTIITIIAGPLNYIGINPKVHCNAPKPSK